MKLKNLLGQWWVRQYFRWGHLVVLCIHWDRTVVLCIHWDHLVLEAQQEGGTGAFPHTEVAAFDTLDADDAHGTFQHIVVSLHTH